MDQKIAAALLCLGCLLLESCGGSSEARLRKLLASQITGILHLPSGVVAVSQELQLAPGAHDLEIVGSGSMLKRSPGFKGRAILVADRVRNIRFREFTLDGGRAEADPPQEMVPPENALRVWYPNNGILADQVQGLAVDSVNFANFTGFAILVSRSSHIRITKALVEDSGSKNAKGRNNLTGGILIEEGSRDFEVRDCTFRRILGNGLWTHSLRTSPRLENGVFADNHFDTIGRDAIQVGHATRVRVEDNTGTRIGWPVEIVDVENGGTPVAIDTAGNVDQSLYSANRFEEINGKCMDLDGFHDGAVRGNACFNRKRPDDYQFGHFGIVMNNTDPDAHASNVEISGNTIDGAKYGALFLMGGGNRIVDNKFLRLNLAQCPDNLSRFACVYNPDEPNLLAAGIYLSRGVARPEQTQGNLIRGNEISGYKMDARCIAAGPGVSLAANSVAANDCSDSSGPQ